MNVFLGIVAKRELNTDEVLFRVREIAAKTLPFAHMDFEESIWRSPSSRTLLFAWNNDSQHFHHSSPIISNDKYAMSFTGYVLDSTFNDENKVFNNMIEGDRNKYISDLGGVFGIGFAMAETDTIEVWNSIIPLHSVYWAETNDYYVVGTRALLVHLFCTNGTAKYRLESFVPFLSAGYFANDITPFEGLNILPPNSHFIASARGVSIKPMDDANVKPDIDCIDPDDAYYDALTQQLLNAVKAIGNHSDELMLNLSSGKDSRLVVAALKEAGVGFNSMTQGLPDHPDVQGVRMIQQLLDIEVNYREPKHAVSSEVKVDLLKRTASDLFLTDGMLHNWPSFQKVNQYDSTVHISGQGGEFLRGIYLKIPERRQDLINHGVKSLFDYYFLRAIPYVNHEHGQTYLNFVDKWIEKNRDLSEGAIFEKFGLYSYGWRWASASFAAKSSQHLRYMPLCDARLVKMALQVSYETRINDSLMFNILKRLNPELCDVPFTKYRWVFEEKGPIDGDVVGWKNREPIYPDRLSESSVNWQNEVGGDLKPEFMEQIFYNKKAEDLFQLVNRDEVEALFHSKQIFTPRSAKFFWNLYTVATMLSNEWLSKEVEGRTIVARRDMARYKLNSRISSILISASATANNMIQKRLEKLITDLQKEKRDNIQKKKKVLQTKIRVGQETIVESYVEKLVNNLHKVQETFKVNEQAWYEYLHEIKLNNISRLHEAIAFDPIAHKIEAMNLTEEEEIRRSLLDEQFVNLIRSPISQMENTIFEALGISNEKETLLK